METVKPLPANPSFEEILEIGRESIAASRVMIDSIDTIGDADKSLKSFLLRVVDCLESLFDPGPVDEGGARIAASALTAFLPVLELDWLPADLNELPELSEKDQTTIGLLRREREMQAAKRAATSKVGTWDPLIDVVSEAIELFVTFGYDEGFGRMIELFDTIEAHSSSRKAPLN